MVGTRKPAGTDWKGWCIKATEKARSRYDRGVRLPLTVRVLRELHRFLGRLFAKPPVIVMSSYVWCLDITQWRDGRWWHETQTSGTSARTKGLHVHLSDWRGIRRTWDGPLIVAYGWE